ncbi:MAG: 4-aminobutyrate--2-oxoglutarate transaminase [Candidatus Eremiobacteraeota bacterium]|nr:4-aminobutyrate--2-oxoglutarate transaminase [Candidatus Eremiobacteraeota bacterium]MBC5828434.1 4-aminobutyrate--2-oxoglutarate transaminase [Candidatus Eremiobacteraeota bacterium]
MAFTASSAPSLLQRRTSEVARGVSNTHPIFVDRAEGVRVWDVEGREYLDFAGGIGTLNVGHSHPKVRAAVAAQLERFTHTCFQVAMYETYVRLSERLNRLAPGPSTKKTLLVTTGAEATENAVKIAREYTGRPGVVAFADSYHGRTLLALSMTGKDAPYKQHFGPFCDKIYHTPFPAEHQGWSSERAIGALKALFQSTVSHDEVAAIIIEPILGEGGFVPAPLEFLRELRSIADRYGIVLVCDEIQSGFGRTGAMFAIEAAGVEADLLCVAKSIAGGLPLAAVIGKAEIMDAPQPGGLGGTFAGNPLACAAALATLDIFESEKLVERASAIGARIEPALRDLKRHHAEVVDVRGRGAMMGIEFSGPRTSGTAGAAAAVVDEARERGLLLLTAGHGGNVIRILVPLIIDDEQLDVALGRLKDSCEAVCG